MVSLIRLMWKENTPAFCLQKREQKRYHEKAYFTGPIYSQDNRVVYCLVPMKWMGYAHATCCRTRDRRETSTRLSTIILNHGIKELCMTLYQGCGGSYARAIRKQKNVVQRSQKMMSFKDSPVSQDKRAVYSLAPMKWRELRTCYSSTEEMT